METIKTIENINETKVSSLKYQQNWQAFVQLDSLRKKRERVVNKIRNGRGEITTGSKET